MLTVIQIAVGPLETVPKNLEKTLGEQEILERI